VGHVVASFLKRYPSFATAATTRPARADMKPTVWDN